MKSSQKEVLCQKKTPHSRNPTHHPQRNTPSTTCPHNLPKVRKDPSVEIIPISLGCNGACTFCQTKLARGSLRSYPVKEILQRVDAVKNTASEIWLTSEDTGAYGQDIGADLITLLQSIQECRTATR